MIPINPAWVVTGLLALGAGGYIAHCEHVKKDRAAFIERLQQDAEKQQRRIEEEKLRYDALKENADVQLREALSKLSATQQRLRDERARASSVPAAPTNASRPDLACFDRVELARAVDNLEAGVEDLLGKGAAAALELESLKVWAKNVWEGP